MSWLPLLFLILWVLAQLLIVQLDCASTHLSDLAHTPWSEVAEVTEVGEHVAPAQVHALQVAQPRHTPDGKQKKRVKRRARRVKRAGAETASEASTKEGLVRMFQMLGVIMVQGGFEYMEKVNEETNSDAEAEDREEEDYDDQDMDEEEEEFVESDVAPPAWSNVRVPAQVTQPHQPPEGEQSKKRVKRRAKRVKRLAEGETASEAATKEGLIKVFEWLGVVIVEYSFEYWERRDELFNNDKEDDTADTDAASDAATTDSTTAATP